MCFFYWDVMNMESVWIIMDANRSPGHTRILKFIGSKTSWEYFVVMWWCLGLDEGGRWKVGLPTKLSYFHAIRPLINVLLCGLSGIKTRTIHWVPRGGSVRDMDRYSLPTQLFARHPCRYIDRCPPMQMETLSLSHVAAQSVKSPLSSSQLFS
jgi:hypothetical protein